MSSTKKIKKKSTTYI